jgi:hypothetical protein
MIKPSSHQTQEEELQGPFSRRSKYLADKNGLGTWDGLYQGDRRVKAQICQGRGLLLGDGWLLAPDEKDLIEALDTDWFPKDVHRADLKKRFGLTIRKELAPTVALMDFPYWGRTDDWGAEAEQYQDDRSLMEKIGIGSIRDFLILLFFWHVSLSLTLFDLLTTAWQRVVGPGVFFGSLVLMGRARDDLMEGAIWLKLLVAIGMIYVILPFWACFLRALMSDDNLPKAQK